MFFFTHVSSRRDISSVPLQEVSPFIPETQTIHPPSSGVYDEPPNSSTWEWLRYVKNHISSSVQNPLSCLPFIYFFLISQFRDCHNPQYTSDQEGAEIKKNPNLEIAMITFLSSWGLLLWSITPYNYISIKSIILMVYVYFNYDYSTQ